MNSQDQDVRLHDDTRWPIVLRFIVLPSEYGDVGLSYEALSENKIIPKDKAMFCSANKLNPRR